MISLGIIGSYIARIYDEVKARPRYVIRESRRARDPPRRTAFDQHHPAAFSVKRSVPFRIYAGDIEHVEVEMTNDAIDEQRNCVRPSGDCVGHVEQPFIGGRDFAVDYPMCSRNLTTIDKGLQGPAGNRYTVDSDADEMRNAAPVKNYASAYQDVCSLPGGDWRRAAR
jgi:hypothetical protein